MTANLDYLKSYAGSLSARPERQIEDVRHGGWLLELERALLANGVTRSVADQQRDTARNEHHMDSRSAYRPPIAQPGAEEKAGPVSSLPDTGSARVRTDTPAFAHREVSGEADERDDASSSSRGTRSASGFSNTAEVSAQQHVAHSDANVWQLSNAVAASYRERQYHAPGNREEAVLRPSPIKPGGTLFPGVLHQAGLLDSLHREEESLPDPAEKTDEDKASDAQAADSLQDSETYSRRKLHIFRSGDGVQAWIRDADVAEFEAHSIARALSSELMASGLRLTALTLNGRKLTDLIQEGPSQEDATLGDDTLSQLQDASNHSLKSGQNITVKGAYSNGD